MVFYLEENASLLSRKKPKQNNCFSYFILVHRQKYSSPESSPIALRLLFLVDRSAKSNWIKSSKEALRNHIYCFGKKLDNVFCWQLPAFPVSSFIFYVSFVSSLLLPASSCQAWDSLTLPLLLSLIADLCFQLSSTSLSQSLSIQFLVTSNLF